MIRVAIAMVMFAGVAHADDPRSSPPASPPASPADPATENRANEANLESTGPRQGVTISFSIGPGLLISKGLSDTVTAATLRFGHVATPNTIVTLEIVGGTFAHTIAGKTLFDSNGAALVGGLYYVNPSVWIRGAGGLDLHKVDNGTTAGKKTLPGLGAAVGVGVDLIRRHYFVLGLEAFVLGGINSDGLATTSAFCLGFSYY